MSRPWWNPLDLLFAHCIASYMAFAALTVFTAITAGRFINLACLACAAPVSLPILVYTAIFKPEVGSIFSPVQAMLLLAAYPTGFTSTIAWVRLRWYLTEMPAGACANCRYNLTGNVSGVCPECGTPVTAGARRSARGDLIEGELDDVDH